MSPMNRYLRFAPRVGKPNTVDVSFGPEASPEGVRIAALKRLHDLVRHRTITEACQFFGDEDAVAQAQELLAVALTEPNAGTE